MSGIHDISEIGGSLLLPPPLSTSLAFCLPSSHIFHPPPFISSLPSPTIPQQAVWPVALMWFSVPVSELREHSHPTLTPNTHTQHSHTTLTHNTHTQNSHPTLTPYTRIQHSHPTLTPNTHTQVYWLECRLPDRGWGVMGTVWRIENVLMRIRIPLFKLMRIRIRLRIQILLVV